MRSGLLFAVAILLTLGILFARDRVKRAFQIGALLYAGLIIVRFILFGRTDPDGFGDLLVVLSIFACIWLLGWLVTTAILRYRDRSRNSRPHI